VGDSKDISAVERSFIAAITVRNEYDGISSFEPRVSTERNNELGITSGASDSSLYRRLNDVTTKQQFRHGMQG